MFFRHLWPGHSPLQKYNSLLLIHCHCEGGILDAALPISKFFFCKKGKQGLDRSNNHVTWGIRRMITIYISLITSVKGSSPILNSMVTRDLLIWQKWEFLYCHKNLGMNDQDRKIYGIIFICCHIGNYPPWQLLRVKQLVIYLYLNSNNATYLT
jgi:hypothetical protein